MIGIFNHYVLARALKKVSQLPPQKGTVLVVSRYLIRLGLDLVALWLARANTGSLLGALIGILAVQQSALWLQVARFKGRR